MASPRMPAHLSRRAQRAWRTAIAAVDDPVRFEMAVHDYCRALSRVDALQAAWEAAQRPVTAPGGTHGKALSVHPLLREIRDGEQHVAKLAEALGLTPIGHRKVKPKLGRPREIVPPLPVATRARQQHLKPVN